ncbi:protein bark beetle isoform X2 [Aethina tumida]|uniref:protein bark beetle isoform X2 n=1 Tax=Aethina tumida TaxID=116153 RepID=UPI0021496643|nr:protein bark beetle isoform X2 [Aethina tumida]
MRTFLFFTCLVAYLGTAVQQESPDEYYNGQGVNPDIAQSKTEHQGGTVVADQIFFTKDRSPYWLRNDLIIERQAEMIVEPGVIIKVEPQVGITVRGTLTAVGTDSERITFTTSELTAVRNVILPDIRLVDGPSILAGRVQIKHKDQWRSVCTNSKNWTIADMETACRQLGFQGGTFLNWYNRQMPLKPRLLYEEPKCRGTESSLLECQWNSRQLGSGVCDYHPDIAIECKPRHDLRTPFWRGLKFEYADNQKRLSLHNTLYFQESLSRLKYVDLLYAGVGRNGNATSAIEVLGVPPEITNVHIVNSAYNAINITKPEAPVKINDCDIQNNRGYGIFINSSFGLAHIQGCNVKSNGGDGIRFVHAEERPEERADKFGYRDFCQIATSSSQTFPIQLYAEQTVFLNKEKVCEKVFTTKYGHVITLNLIRAITTRNDSGTIEIYDGSTLNHRLLTTLVIRNNTRPQSITTTGNQIFVKFRADARTDSAIYLRILSGLQKTFDLNVTNSNVSSNIGRGISVDNLRSQVHVHKTYVSKNEHVAGVHVTSGVGDVNITESVINFNVGDGVNITYTGGSRNISRSKISSNEGYGAAIWLNHTQETEFVFINQTTVIQYNEFEKNLDIGVLHGNYCGDAFFNITGNSFTKSFSDALEVLTCWIGTNTSTKLQIGHNVFRSNERIAIKIYPAVNLNAKIEYNHFKMGTFGALLIKNKPLEQFNILPTDITVRQNYFINNTGTFVVNLALSPYALDQKLLFTRNFVKNNKITEPFQPDDGSVSNLNPRSRVAAPVVVGSNNVDVFRNIIDNPDSKYEVGSHLEDQSKTINCTYNWLGDPQEDRIFERLFHRYSRYNLAKIKYIPYLLHNSNPLTTRVMEQSLHVPRFFKEGTNVIGGEVEGEETIVKGEYVVDKDINIRPNGKLTIEPGVVIKFPPSIGMLIGGRLEANGGAPDGIKFTLKEELSFPPENETLQLGEVNEEDLVEQITPESLLPIRLLGGSSETEGRLQIRINNQWGTVCNYGWTIENAALVCQQLGHALNPKDWYMERSEIPDAGTTEKVILTNVQCDDFDMDITKCKAERLDSFENSCGHENDVGVRCYKTSWAGLRFGSLAERSNIQFITIEKSGLLDYATNSFKPALQLDFARQNFENIKVSNNYHHGLGVIYSDIYTDDTVNNIKNCEFTDNKGAGVAFKQYGFEIFGSTIERNYIGVKHDPMLNGLHQRELAGWFTKTEDETSFEPSVIPELTDQNDIYIGQGRHMYLVTSKVENEQISRSYKIKCDPGWVIGIQLLNPIENRSTESIKIHDSLTYNFVSDVWILKRDLTIFPTTSTAPGIIIDYSSGPKAFGGTVLMLSTIRAPAQTIFKRIVKGQVPTLSLRRTKIRNNKYGVHLSYYSRYLDELGNHFLRKANETLKMIDCEISHNENEAIFTHSPYWDLHYSNLSEITIMLNTSLITDNGKGIFQFSRDMRASNNLFHYVLQDNTIERNKAGGFDISLPYVWQYNENFTHTVYMDNNTWANNRNFEWVVDGHFSSLNLTRETYKNNYCKTGLLTIKGMEKKMYIRRNTIQENNGKYMVLFSSTSQSEIIGNVPALFYENELKDNRYQMKGRGFGILQLRNEPTFAVGFKGIQKVLLRRNLFTNNAMDYQLVAGIKTAKINNYLDVAENWWGTTLEEEIKNVIFDFDDWNDHAIAKFLPYLLSGEFEGDLSITYYRNTSIDMENLGGRITENVELRNKGSPYIIRSDLTVMPNTVFTIYPGVVMEFAPNVGMLVLGSLIAKGYKDNEIIMRPITRKENLMQDDGSHPSYRDKRSPELLLGGESIRLCKNRGCDSEILPTQGFLEYFNKTTLQWIPMCDPRFTERNAQVVCRELGFEPLNAYFEHGVRIDYHSNSLSRIWTWPEPLQCMGTEKKYEECPIRLNGQQFGHRHRCEWDSKFIFISCDNKSPETKSYWGGLRFADAEFEQELYSHRIHDAYTHTTKQTEESVLEYVKIEGAGILHNEKSSAIQTVIKSPKINYCTVKNSAFHGIDLISPSNTMNLLHNDISNNMGIGVNILSLSGEGKESDESSFTPLRALNYPYNLFSLVDICDTHKEIRIEERILLYYKYDNHPVNCIKIFRSAYNIKPLGFRLLQFNLFNTTTQYGIPDFISLYDGDIYNVSSTVIGRISTNSENEKKMFKTKLPSLSVKLFANGASSDHGFIAEIVTLPMSAIGFNRDVQHNISSSMINYNRQGGILYNSVGEVNPVVTIEKTQFKANCRQLYGNFTTCKSAIHMDVQNTHTIYFRNNLVDTNQGGLYIKADSRGSATSLRGWIHNNLFVNNSNLPTLYVEGRQSSPYQEVTIYRNYFTRNIAQYHNNIILRQVVSNFTYNYVKRNIGQQNLEVSGFDRVRLNIYQTTTHNGFYHNFAVNRDSRSTIVAGTAGQHYIDNILWNPDNDYEMITVNRTLTLQLWNTKIDAANNYWGVNTSLAVRGRIRDQSDDPKLLEVIFEPYLMNNKTVLDGKCPPGWALVGETCYMYVGAPMSFPDAKSFCQADNASVPYLIGNTNYVYLYDFLRSQHQWYLYSDKVWVQHIDRISECTAFAYQNVETSDCGEKHPFICEIDPKVSIKILPRPDDVVLISIISSSLLAIILLIAVIACWYAKSKFRKAQRLERRNSIRQSLNSLRSVGLSPTSYSEASYRRKAALASRSTDTLTKDYKKINGSFDSMEKSVYNSSIEDNHSVDTYTTNPNPFGPTIELHKSPNRYENQYAKPHQYDLGYKNAGFKDNSTFNSASNFQSRSDVDDRTPIIESQNGGSFYHPSDYYNADTLPLSKSQSTFADRGYATPSFEYVEDRPRSDVLETNFDEPVPSRSKSEAVLETNFDFTPPGGSPQFNHPLSDESRSKSQPLETAM